MCFVTTNRKQFHQVTLKAFRFVGQIMSSAAASSWDTRVASGMMLALQCLMFLGFYFAVRHVESVACSAAQQLHSSLRTITLTPAPTLTPTPSHPHPHPPQAEYGHDFNIAFYNAYIGVTIMMLVGFGYLMAFLKCYGLGAVGFTFVITCLALQAHSRTSSPRKRSSSCWTWQEARGAAKGTWRGERVWQHGKAVRLGGG